MDQFLELQDNKNKWQRIASLMSKLLDIDIALINRIYPASKSDGENKVEVLYKNQDESNPYSTEKEYQLKGLYCEKVFQTGEMLEVNNALKADEWDDNPSVNMGIISYLGYPIKDTDGNVFGTICVEDKGERQFTDTEKELLEEFRDVLEDSIKQAELYQQLDNHIQKGKKLHKQFLPKQLPDISELSFGTFYQAANQLGGDFYDFVEFKDQLLFYISDVSGHDLSSSMLNIFLKEAINSYLTLEQGSYDKIVPGEILRYIEHRFQVQDFNPENFITMTLGVIDLNNYELEICNAGIQQYPIIIDKEGKLIKLETKNFMISNLNYSNKRDFKSIKWILNPGDMLFLTTDGLLEQSCVSGSNYYKNYLMEILSDIPQGDPDNMINEIIEDFKVCLSDKPLSDDLTIMAIKRNDNI